MLINNVRKYYNKDIYDLNCAETMVYAANEEYNMSLAKETLKSVAAFGGGMGVEDICGAVTGALAVIGILFTVERAHESDKVKNLAKEFIERFELKLNSTNCRVLKEKYRTDEKRCIDMVEAAAEILDDIILRNINK